MKEYIIREIKPEEIHLLNDFLYEAIFIPEGVPEPPRSIIENEDLQVYVRDFGKKADDRCLVAEVDGKIVGAVWTRVMNDYGHIADGIPSLAISLYKDYRHQGIGTDLLRKMLQLLRRDGYPQVSLSVQKANYAFRMYQKAGFEVLKETEEEYLMVCNLKNQENNMNAKKLIVFLLFAFLPMVAVGVFMHYCGASAEEAAADAASGDPLTAIKRLVMSAGSMLIPLLAVIFTQLIFKEPVLKGLGISFKLNRWWWIGWLLMPVIAMMVLGVTLLMPGANWTPDGEMARQSLQGMPDGTGVWGLIGITLLSGLFAGITLNAVFAFGEELAWRGFLVKEFKGKKFMSAALLIGVIWGFWHAPLILNGHNYPEHPVAGVFMMVILCVLLTLMLLYFRKKSGSVIVPAIMHGTINAVAGVTAIVVSPDNDLLYGAAGVAGMLVLLMVDACLYLYDKYVSKENLFTLFV